MGLTSSGFLFSLNVFLSGFGDSGPFGVAAATAPDLRTSQAERGPVPGAPSDLLELRTFGYPRTWQLSQSEGGGLGGRGYGAGRAAVTPPPPRARSGKQAAKAPGGFSCKPGAELHHGSRELPALAARSPRPSPARPPARRRCPRSRGWRGARLPGTAGQGGLRAFSGGPSDLVEIGFGSRVGAGPRPRRNCASVSSSEIRGLS